MAKRITLPRAVAAVAVGAAGCIYVVPSPGSALVTDPPQAPNFYQHNIAGAAINSGSFRATENIKFTAAAFSDYGLGIPWAISLNESCWSQAMELADWLSNRYGLTYTVNFWDQRSANPVATCGGYQFLGAGKYGVATLTLGSADVTATSFLHQEYAYGDVEERGYVCVKAGIPSPKYWFCSAHTYYDKPQNQFAEYKVLAEARSGTLPIVWAGDLYRTPSQISGAHPTFYTYNSEADHYWSPTDRNTSQQSAAKVDHIFYRRPKRQPTQAAVVNGTYCPLPHTSCPPHAYYDHKLIGGFFQV